MLDQRKAYWLVIEYTRKTKTCQGETLMKIWEVLLTDLHLIGNEYVRIAWLTYEDWTYGIINGHSCCHTTARGVDVDVDRFLGIFRFQEQELRDNNGG
jgi:hypothetical protein